VAKAAPDGYTIGTLLTPHVVNPFVLKNLPYNTERDFTPVSLLVIVPGVMTMYPGVGPNNLKEVIALAKAKPGQLNFASSGHGTNTHLSGELFKLETGANITHIPYKGSGPATTDLLAGRVQMSFQIPITVIPMIAAGKLKPVALTGDGRLDALPQVPTFAEAGLPGYGITGVTGMMAPAKTPIAIRRKISKDVAEVLQAASSREFLAKQGVEPFITTSPEDMDKVLRDEIARYGRIIKAAGIKYEP